MSTSAAFHQAGSETWLQVSVVEADLWLAWEELRRASSLPAVAATGASQGFRVEDLSRVTVQANAPGDAEAWLRRRLPAECELVLESPDDSAGAGTRLDARF